MKIIVIDPKLTDEHITTTIFNTILIQFKFTSIFFLIIDNVVVAIVIVFLDRKSVV